MHATMDEHGNRKDRYVTDKQTLNFEKRAAAGTHRNRRRNEVLPSAPRCDSIMSHRLCYPPWHRKILRRAAQISFFSCLLLSVASSNNNNHVELKECTAPRVANNYFNQFNKRKNISPREVAQLGDGRRSSEASGSFFDFLDRDGDGSLGTEEVALFLRDQIGGSQFDTQLEVDNEVETVMERLDKNDNNELEMSDILDYWMQLESLLTAEEVRDWIVYSVQLPKSVGE